MLNIILRIIGLIFLIGGVIMVYDARILTRNWFGFGDQNEDNIAYTYANSFEWLLDRERSGKRIHGHYGAGTDGS